MRTYLLLKQKARAFAAHAGIQTRSRRDSRRGRRARNPPRDGATRLKAETFDRRALASRRLAYERLDQLAHPISARRAT
jgi:hypothetical protein